LSRTRWRLLLVLIGALVLLRPSTDDADTVVRAHLDSLRDGDAYGHLCPHTRQQYDEQEWRDRTAARCCGRPFASEQRANVITLAGGTADK
jgi:hypothetical protein